MPRGLGIAVRPKVGPGVRFPEQAGGREWLELAEATDGSRDCGGAAFPKPLIDSSGAVRR